MTTTDFSSAGANAPTNVVLAVENLHVEFAMPDGTNVRAVNGVSYQLNSGETLAIVGESGSGKSVTALSVLGLLRGGTIKRGKIIINGNDVLEMDPVERRKLLGSEIASIFQNPTSALNPLMKVGDQIVETLLVKNRDLTKREARKRVFSLLSAVGVPEPEVRANSFPHQFSGGMCQRVVIAIAIANEPRILIADEPTTAVDVTIQAQLLDLIEMAKLETGASTVLITHDLGVVAQAADRVAVMYGGRIVEYGDVFDIFERPSHPYTGALLGSMPRIDEDVENLEVIPGQPPDMTDLPVGCAFQPRCAVGKGRVLCGTTIPDYSNLPSGQGVACHYPLGEGIPPSLGDNQNA